MIGLELDDSSVVAVDVDETGRVLARAHAADADLGAAATRALGDISSAAGALTPLGISAIHPESPVVAQVLAQLAPRYAGPFSRTGAVPSGTAAAAAEAWIGAARG